MSDQFLAEIRVFPFDFAPLGWALCNGQIMPISQNTALFSLLGTNYGGDGRSTFGLPNLQGRVAMHTTQYSTSRFGQYPIGQQGGEANVTLLQAQMSGHTHTLNADSVAATSASPVGAMPALGVAMGGGSSTPVNGYTDATPADTGLSLSALAVAGGGGAHNNMAPYLTLNFCIALQGIYPPRS